LHHETGKAQKRHFRNQNLAQQDTMAAGPGFKHVSRRSLFDSVPRGSPSGAAMRKRHGFPLKICTQKLSQLRMSTSSVSGPHDISCNLLDRAASIRRDESTNLCEGINRPRDLEDQKESRFSNSRGGRTSRGNDANPARSPSTRSKESPPCQFSNGMVLWL
jgi:hypothetical protein